MSNQHATYKVFFGFQKEPFGQNVRVEDMMKSTALIGVKERFLYAVGLCAALVITGDVGSGKSSGLRFASSLLHPSEYKVLLVTATSGTIIELYKQICHALDIQMKNNSKAVLTRIIRTCLLELAEKKQKPVLIVDEASILRLDVFTELHTITQFEGDSRPILPIILAGQNNLIDNLMYRQVHIPVNSGKHSDFISGTHSDSIRATSYGMTDTGLKLLSHSDFELSTIDL